MLMNTENLTFAGGVGLVVLGFCRWIAGLLVKPLILRISDLERENLDVIKSVEKSEEKIISILESTSDLRAREHKNADFCVDLSDRIARVDLRVQEADKRSSENEKSMVKMDALQIQFSREKSKLFDKTDSLDEKVTSLKESVAGISRS